MTVKWHNLNMTDRNYRIWGHEAWDWSQDPHHEVVKQCQTQGKCGSKWWQTKEQCTSVSKHERWLQNSWLPQKICFKWLQITSLIVKSLDNCAQHPLLNTVWPCLWRNHSVWVTLPEGYKGAECAPQEQGIKTKNFKLKSIKTKSIKTKTSRQTIIMMSWTGHITQMTQNRNRKQMKWIQSQSPAPSSVGSQQSIWLQKDKQSSALSTADSEQLMGESYTGTFTVKCHVEWGQSVKWTVEHVEHSGNLSDPMLTIADAQPREEIDMRLL